VGSYNSEAANTTLLVLSPPETKTFPVLSTTAGKFWRACVMLEVAAQVPLAAL
jgi:hypothetical protein